MKKITTKLTAILGALVLGGLPIMADDIQMVTYFPVPYATFDNIYMQGVTHPTFTVGVEKGDGESTGVFRAKLGSKELDGSHPTQSLQADEVVLDPENVKNVTLSFGDVDVYTQTATLGTGTGSSEWNLGNPLIKQINGTVEDITVGELILNEVELYINGVAFPRCSSGQELQWRTIVMKKHLLTGKPETTRRYLECVSASEDPELFATHEWTSEWADLKQQHCVLNSGKTGVYCDQMNNSTLDLTTVLMNSKCNGVDGRDVSVMAHTSNFWALKCKDIDPSVCGSASEHQDEYCFVFNMHKDLALCDGISNHPSQAQWGGELEWDSFAAKVTQDQRRWTSDSKSVGPVCLFHSTQIKK